MQKDFTPSEKWRITNRKPMSSLAFILLTALAVSFSLVPSMGTAVLSSNDGVDPLLHQNRTKKEVNRKVIGLSFGSPRKQIIRLPQADIIIQPDDDDPGFRSNASQGPDGAIPEWNGTTGGWVENYRIPEDTLPLHYELYLHPNLETDTFEGKVYIHVDITKPRDYLVTHIKHLKILKSVLFKGNLTMDDPTAEPSGEVVADTKSFEYKKNEFLVMTARGTIQPGLYTWYISFVGSLTNGIVGFYKSVYTTSAGEERVIATSKFQPTYARRAFPCFDEPSFKSSFRTILVRPSCQYIALSNMDVEKEIPDKPEAGKTTVYFRSSVRMVTYLACFIVCDFEHTELKTNDGVPFRVYARPEQVEKTRYALEIGTNISNYFVDYFKVPYPLPKQDMIAIPDFVSGAMEHWGLITYREVNLLYHAETSAATNKYRIATVVAHELAHMWFGNLMTVKWWDDLWLNEGFASFIEYKGVDPFEKNWDLDAQFIVQDLTGVMELDAQVSSHPIVQQVHHPDEITSLFDKITYNKGASVLRMLEDFMTPEVFREGVSRFIKKFSFENAVTQDLYFSLQEVWKDNNGYTVAQVMDTWTKQMGFPVISVKRTSRHFELTQERFLADPNANASKPSPFNYQWEVPISYRIWKNGKWEEKRTWLSSCEGRLEIPRPQGVDWVKVNNDFKGFYVVSYEKDVWKEFINQLSTQAERDKFSVQDRANLYSDAFMQASAGRLSYDIPLELAKSLHLEKHSVPWILGRGSLSHIAKLLKPTNISSQFQAFMKSISAPLYDESGFVDPGNEDMVKTQLQIRIVGMACGSKHEPCLKEAQRQFEEWLETGRPLPPNMRELVFAYGMDERLGTGEHWQKMFDRYMNEGDASTRIAYLRGLAHTPSEDQLRKYLELAKDPKNVRRQDFFTVLGAISGNPAGTSLVWDFYREEWETFFVRTFTLNDRYLGNVIKTITSSFATPERKAEMEAFYAKYPEAGAGASARRDALEHVHNNIKWMERSIDQIANWLSSSSSSGSGSSC